MTMLDTLFGLIPANSRMQQWVAEDLQLVNWGGYDGHHRIRFSPTATLLCGGSGSGKSTLMDAYIALMMPHTTPFNGASNGAVTGRPRGQEQRNIVSYGRGKLDESRDADGATRMRVLRGDGADTWTAVAMTWADQDGARFTAVRAWYIPSSARVLDDTVRIRGTSEGDFDLRRLEPAAGQRLVDSAVRGAGVETVGTDREFSSRLHTALGIGAAGAGSKAMSLLARIQAGQQITTVDDLYKKMVLEEPETMATADAVVAHFDGLDGTRNRMLTARQQVRALEPIRGIRTRIGAAAARMRLIDAVGNFADPDSLASLWQASRRQDLLHAVETELRARKLGADQAVRERQEIAKAAEAERDALSEVLRTSGGDRLDTAQRELRDVERRTAEVERQRARLEEALRSIDTEVRTARQFAALAEKARLALVDGDSRSSARDAYAEARAARSAIEKEIAGLEAERRQAEDRSGNIPAPLHESREQLARAAGLEVEELPFVGELVEVRTEYEPWREAFNLALGGFATTLLIDSDNVARFRTAINAVRTPVRLRYEGIAVGQPMSQPRDDRTLPGRLDYRATGFTGWLQERLVDRFNFFCVTAPEELRGHSTALTISGQMSQGNRGAHGGHGRANVLGFSNQHGLRDLAARIDDARRRLVDAIETLEAAVVTLDGLDARDAAYRVVVDLTWEQVDVEALEAEKRRWLGVIEEVTTGSPTIARIQQQIAKTSDKVTGLREDIGRAKHERDRIAARWGEVMEAVDAVDEILEAAGDAGIRLTDEQAGYLDRQFEVPDGERDASPSEELRRFDAALENAAGRLAADQRAARDSLVEQRETLRRTLTTFLDRWPNPNLLPDPDASLADFERILADLEASGLHELEAEWRDSLLSLSGNDLTNLDSTLSRSLREIRERIEPINLIMQDLPFYDDEHRLQIATRENQSAVRARFRRELRDVRGLIEAAGTEEERELAYTRMSRLIDRIRRGAPDFADLIDVRNHVRVSAERIGATTKRHVALYDHIGEKSGGESQELIAFIVGAALRYQLGDAGAERPRYAPVFLDEALIKADAHFTARAIGAWRGLGFQLIIGAPNDKYSAIEPHVDVEYDILKDTRGRSWARPKVAL